MMAVIAIRQLAEKQSTALIESLMMVVIVLGAKQYLLLFVSILNRRSYFSYSFKASIIATIL